MKNVGMTVLSWLIPVLLSAIVWMPPGSAQAQEWQSFRLAEAVVEIPPDWTTAYSQKDREIRLASPDGNFQLLAFWWFPDEPLLGYDDIVSHERLVVAGRPALLIHSEYPELGVLSLAFEDAREDGHVLVVNLEFGDRNYGKASILMKDVMSRIRFGEGRNGNGQRGQVDQPNPVEPNERGGSPERYSDDEGGFAISYPADWNRSTATRKGMRLVVVEAPLGAGLVLAGSFYADDAEGLSRQMDAYEQLYYQEYVVPESIEADEELSLGGLEGRAVDAIADIYAVEGTRLAFRKGWSRFIRAEDGQRAYVIAIIHGLNADQALKSSLFAVAESFAAVPGEDDANVAGSAVPLPAKGGLPTSRLSGRFGDDCHDFDLAQFSHPTRDRFGQGAGARLKWVMLCSEYSYPVFGAEFEYDPGGQTGDFFHPLYLDLLEALGEQSYAIVALDDALVIRIGRGFDSDLDIEIDPLDEEEIAELAGSPETAAGDDLPALPLQPPAGSQDKDGDTADLLFDGKLSEFWQPLSVAGGDFSRFATFEDGTLSIDVPVGNAWGKTGIWSRHPVVMPVTDDDVKSLRFGFDAAATTSFVLALGPADNPEEWETHDIRFAWSRTEDGAAGTARLYVRRQEVWRLATVSDAPESIVLSVGGDGVVKIELPDGRWMEAVLPGVMAPEGYRIYALAHAPNHNLAARMALRSIALERTKQIRSGPQAYPDPRDDIVLFDRELGRQWLRYSSAGGDFSRDGRLTRDGLVVEVPPGNAWGNVGIFSPTPLVWLDDFRGAGELSIVFEIDPERTDGFRLTLAQPNVPDSPNVSYYWYRPKGSGSGRADVHVNPHRQGDFDSRDLPSVPPSEVRFTLRPNEVTIEAAGMEPVTRPWSEALEGSGFHIYAHSIVPAHDEPTRFALKSIRMNRKPGSRTAESGPATGVDPLPLEPVFDGKINSFWEPAAVAGGNFETFARFEDGVLAIDVPERNSWGKTGLLSAGSLVQLDSRASFTPTRIEIALVPDERHNLVVALSRKKSVEMWPDHVAWYSFNYLPDRKVWAMGIRHSPYHDWSREIDAEWMAKNWDGRLWIDVGSGRTSLSIPDGPTVSAPAGMAEGSQLFATILAHAPKEHAAAHLALRHVRLGLRTPDGMTVIDRLILADDDQFDVDAFADALAAAE